MAAHDSQRDRERLSSKTHTSSQDETRREATLNARIAETIVPQIAGLLGGKKRNSGVFARVMRMQFPCLVS